MKPTRDKSKHASHSKSTSQSKRSGASDKERGGHASHGSAGKSSERAGAKSHERGAQGGSGREHATHSPTGIQKALKGASYPAKKQELVKTAQANGAETARSRRCAIRPPRPLPDAETNRNERGPFLGPFSLRAVCVPNRFVLGHTASCFRAASSLNFHGFSPRFGRANVLVVREPPTCMGGRRRLPDLIESTGNHNAFDQENAARDCGAGMHDPRPVRLRRQ
ncbi:MAG: DUF2795 domain-containing protein [Ralstonia sp.]|uniref:DUF2795 domain-containing protein n=1 Tax=Ralstonia sp. TaxID=54061 RepID=UPI003F7EBE36